MKVNSVQSQHSSFGKIILGESIRNVLKSKRKSNAFMYELDKIELSLGVLGVDSKNNVDVILNHNQKEGFWGVISSKKFGIPDSFFSTCKVSKEYDDIITFSNWVNEWDDYYSKRMAQKISDSSENVMKIVKKN